MIPSSLEGISAFERILFDACALLRPPEHLTCSEWADKYGMLSAEGSAQPGKWYTSNAEYQREPLDAISDPNTETIVLAWSSQVGKTAIGLFGFAYFAEHDPCPQIIVQPTEDMAKTVMKDRIAPMIRDTPRLKSIFSSNKGEEWNSKAYPGGGLTMAWAQSPSQLASRAKRFGWSDEEGRMENNKEGDPIDQLIARLATFLARRKHLRTSSPALLKTCRITRAFRKSDQRRYYVPCPQCGHMQTLRFEQLKWVRESLEPDNVQLTDCYYVCEQSGCEIREGDKYTMIREGKWIAENPGGGDGRTAGFHLNALYSTIGFGWAEVVQKYLKCQGVPDKLQVFQNTVLAEPWDEQAEGADMGEIQKRAEEYSAPAPDWVLMVTCGTDVQKDRIESTKWGFGLNEVSGALEHRIFYGDTSQPFSGAWLEFNAWRRQKVEHETGIMLPVVCTFVDSGDGNRTQTVYEYCKRYESEGVRACKGSSLSGSPLVNEARRVGRQKTLLVIVGSSTAKDMLFARLQIADKTKPGYIHFPKSIDSGCGPEYFQHLTAEALVTRQTKGGAISKWEKRGRNESLDCAVYALAARIFTKAPMRVLAQKLQAAAARLTPEQRLATMLVRALPPRSASSESSPASPSQPPAGTPKKRRKIIRRPMHGWITGS